MTTQTISGPMAPTANIAVNKSRVKLYNKTTEPTYYLQKGQEFEIELFNPTQDTILAKIILNNKPLSQGGLVLKPGERVFIERYLDVAKKFLFDTYEVSDTTEVQKAIEKNGDFKVQFFKERQSTFYYNSGTGNVNSRSFTTLNNNFTNLANNVSGSNVTLTNTGNIGISTSSITNKLDIKDTTTNYSSSSINNGDIHDGLATMDFMSQSLERSLELPIKKSVPRTRCSVEKKTVETGRVEKGSDSDQKIKQVQMDFEYFPFHTVEAKLLPISQKINTSKDLHVRQYCTNCGQKTSKGDKFCSGCGKKI